MKSYWKHTVPVRSNQTVFPAHWVHTSPQDMLLFLRNSFGKASTCHSLTVCWLSLWLSLTIGYLSMARNYIPKLKAPRLGNTCLAHVRCLAQFPAPHNEGGMEVSKNILGSQSLSSKKIVFYLAYNTQVNLLLKIVALVLNVYTVASNSGLTIYVYSLKAPENNLGGSTQFLAPLIWPAVHKLQSRTG